MSYEYEHGTLIPRWWLDAITDARHSRGRVDAGYEAKCEADVERIEKLELT